MAPGAGAHPQQAGPGQPAETTGPNIGEPAADFAAANVHGSVVRLSSLHGRWVLLVFVPFAFTPVCAGEVEDLVHAAPTWRRRGVDVVVVSCDAMPTLRTWADQHGAGSAGVEVLSDFWPHGRIARSYGAFSESDGAADRLSVLIDPAGIVRWSTTAARGRPRPVADYEAAIEALTRPAPSSAAPVTSPHSSHGRGGR